MSGLLDWGALMRLGMRDLRIAPRVFWDLSPAELALIAGLDPAAAPAMGRARLDALSALYPDERT